jgi:hypothetical protein
MKRIDSPGGAGYPHPIRSERTAIEAVMAVRTQKISSAMVLTLVVFLASVVQKAAAVTVTFDAGVGRPASYTEAGITVVPADNPEDHVHLGDNDDNGSPDLMLHPLCCSTPYQFTFSGGTFSLARLDFVLVGGTHTFTSSSGASIAPTASGTVAFPADGWQGITSFTWRNDGVSIDEQGVIDNLQFCPGDCDDGNPCTTDRCEPDSPGADANGCTHVPNDAACDDGVFCNGADSCSGGACAVHAGDPCIAGPACADTCNEKAGNCFAPAGTPCTDDDNVCTDDRCDANGICRHAAVADGPAVGFVAAPLSGEGEECEEDADACTEDVCRSGVCAHERLVAPKDCTLLQDALRQALSLETQSGGLAIVAGDDGLKTGIPLLTRVHSDLSAAARALGGKNKGVPGFFESPLRRRVRLALLAVQRTRPRIAGFLRTLSRPGLSLDPEVTKEVERRAHVLNQGVKALKAELRRLHRLFATFARTRRTSSARNR